MVVVRSELRPEHGPPTAHGPLGCPARAETRSDWLQLLLLGKWCVTGVADCGLALGLLIRHLALPPHIPAGALSGRCDCIKNVNNLPCHRHSEIFHLWPCAANELQAEMLLTYCLFPFLAFTQQTGATLATGLVVF